MSATTTMAKRYLRILCDTEEPDPFKRDADMSHPHLIWMCQIIINHDAEWPQDKSGRWLGFVQGIMAAQRLITTTEERDFSRSLFLGDYESKGIPNPGTYSR